MPDRHTRWRRSRPHALAMLGFSVLAVAATWPLAAHLGTHLLDTGDTPLHYWNCWWVQQALFSGQSPLATTNLFYPTGVSLLTHNIPWLNALFYTFAEPLLGGTRAYNLSLLANLALCGWAAFLLIRRLTGDPRAAFVGGVIYEAWPYRTAQLGHPNLGATFFIPLTLYLMIGALESGRRREALLAGLCLALVGYTRWQQLVPLAIVLAIWAVFWLPPRLRAAPRRTLTMLALAGAVAAVLLLPPAAMLWDQQADEATAASLMRPDNELSEEMDLLAPLTPTPEHPLFGLWGQYLYTRYYAHRGEGYYPAYIGLITVTLALWGIVRRPKKAALWLAMALAMLACALGPELQINGQRYPQVATLYRLLEPLAFLRLIRYPERLAMFAALPVSVLAAMGAQLWISRWRRAGWGVLAGLCVLIPLDYCVAPLDVEPVEVPAIYAQLAGGDGAILDLPIDDIQAKKDMYAQTVHGRPIMGGNLSRIPESAYQTVSADPWLSTLRRASEMPTGVDIGSELQRLAEMNVEYIVLHKDRVEKDRLLRWQRALLIEPFYEDESLAVYATSPQAGVDYDLDRELAPGLGIVTANLGKSSLGQGDVLAVDVGWGAAAAPGADYDVVLCLRDLAGRTFFETTAPVCAQRGTGGWPANTATWGHYTITIPEDALAGRYAVIAELRDPATGRSASPAADLGRVTIISGMPPQELPPGVTRTNADFGQLVSLEGCRIERGATSIIVNLFWRTEQHMTPDYTVFVHVYDLATEIPVAQNDSQPRGGTLPTSYWWPGDLIPDRIEVPLTDVAEGYYGLAVGLYDLATGERVLLTSHGVAIEDSRYVLPVLASVPWGRVNIEGG